VLAAPALPPPAPVPSVRVTPQGPAIGLAKPTRPLMLSYTAPLVTQTPAPGTGAPGVRPAAPPTTVAFKGGEIPGVKASAALDTTYVLMPGLLPCVLDTAISSDVPSGSLMCHTPGPVYSPKGVLLMEADTQIIGRYEGLKNGGNRLQAVSTYAVTPNGIFVPITDNISDDIGRTGLDGNVDHRYIGRFGAAIALTLTQSVLSILQAEASQGGNAYIQLGNGGGGGVGGIAEQILQSTINLPPVFSKPQGSTIAIFLSAPVDFSASYHIREAK
jgi:type IV secretion system protein VirB10